MENQLTVLWKMNRKLGLYIGAPRTGGFSAQGLFGVPILRAVV